MSMEEHSDNKPPHTCPAERGDRGLPKHTRHKKGQGPNRKKACDDTKSELRDVYNGSILCGPSGKRRRFPVSVVMARAQRDRALSGDHRAAEFVINQVKEFGFLDETFQFSIRDCIPFGGFDLLSESMREELLRLEREVKAEAENAKKRKMN